MDCFPTSLSLLPPPPPPPVLPLSLQETYEAKRNEFLGELQKKEEEMRQMFVQRVKEKEAELKEAEKEVTTMQRL